MTGAGVGRGVRVVIIVVVVAVAVVVRRYSIPWFHSFVCWFHHSIRFASQNASIALIHSCRFQWIRSALSASNRPSKLKPKPNRTKECHTPHLSVELQIHLRRPDQMIDNLQHSSRVVSARKQGRQNRQV